MPAVPYTPLSCPHIDAWARGVRPDNGDNSPRFNALIEEAGATPIYVRPGEYQFLSALVLRDQTRIIGFDPPRWLANSSSATVFKIGGGFTGSGLIVISDDEGVGTPTSGLVQGITLDGVFQAGAGIHGLVVEGSANDWMLSRVNIRNFSGNGLHVAEVSGRFVQELRAEYVWVYGCGGDGFHLESGVDSDFSYCMSTTNDGDGWDISHGSANTRYLACGAEWNEAHGFHVRAFNYGPVFIAPKTDRNNFHGFFVDSASSPSGDQVVVVSPKLNRDGRNNNSGGGGYAGLAVRGASGNTAPTVWASDVTTKVGRNDDGTGTYSPAYGISTTYTDKFRFDGRIWGQAGAVTDGGTSLVDYGFGTQFLVGDPPTPTSTVGSFMYFDGSLVQRDSGIIVNNGGIGDMLILSDTGYVEGREIADPAAPASNYGRAYFRDNGSGKTQFVVRFPTGAVQVLATEP